MSNCFYFFPLIHLLLFSFFQQIQIVFVGFGVWDVLLDSSIAVWYRVGSSVCVGLGATEAPAGSRGAGAQGASTNELHSFPHFGIWWPIVLGHRGRSDAICWHVLSFSQTVHPTEAPTSRRQARAACCFTR